MRQQLINKLNDLPDVEVALYKNSDLLCVFYKGKEVAHFQNESEIDIRLSRAIIKREGLVPPENSTSHPNRSKNSIWIVQAFCSDEDVDKLVRLVQMATDLHE